MNDSITELETELLVDLHKERLENIKIIENLPEGIDSDKFLAKVALYSKYQKYIVLGDEQIADTAATRNFIINPGSVRTSKHLGYEWTSSDRERAEAIANTGIGLSIMQRELQVALAQELDNYLDSNPSVKIANAFFISFENLRWGTTVLFDDVTHEQVMCCSFLLRFNTHID